MTNVEFEVFSNYLSDTYRHAYLPRFPHPRSYVCQEKCLIESHPLVPCGRQTLFWPQYQPFRSYWWNSVGTTAKYRDKQIKSIFFSNFSIKNQTVMGIVDSQKSIKWILYSISRLHSSYESLAFYQNWRNRSSHGAILKIELILGIKNMLRIKIDEKAHDGSERNSQTYISTQLNRILWFVLLFQRLIRDN